MRDAPTRRNDALATRQGNSQCARAVNLSLQPLHHIYPGDFHYSQSIYSLSLSLHHSSLTTLTHISSTTMHVPRFARVFVLALTLVTVPSLYFFYPGPANPDHIQSSLDKGGIDSDHIREPVVPHLAYPDHNNQNAQDGHDHQQNHQQVQQGNGRPVFEDEAARDDEEIESGANDDHVDVDDAEDDDYADVAGPAAVTETLADNAIGKVIMPKLGNATAK